MPHAKYWKRSTRRCYWPNIKALALTVWDKKIFKVFSWNSYLWSFLKVHHPAIISVKFHRNLLGGFRWEDFLSNRSPTDGHRDGRTDARHWSITIAHPEHVVLRWAKKVKLLRMSNFTFFHNVFYAICILKSFNRHISFVICSFFEYGTVSKWCHREWAKRYYTPLQRMLNDLNKIKAR